MLLSRKRRLLPTLAIAISVVSPTGNSFQSNASIAAVVVRDIRVAFKEWRVPTPGSHPHDPLATSDGAIWYTGQLASRTCRKTGYSSNRTIIGTRSAQPTPIRMFLLATR